MGSTLPLLGQTKSVPSELIASLHMWSPPQVKLMSGSMVHCFGKQFLLIWIVQNESVLKQGTAKPKIMQCFLLVSLYNQAKGDLHQRTYPNQSVILCSVSGSSHLTGTPKSRWVNRSLLNCPLPPPPPGPRAPGLIPTNGPKSLLRPSGTTWVCNMARCGSLRLLLFLVGGVRGWRGSLNKGAYVCVYI